MERELMLRVTLIHPPKDVHFCVRRGKANLIPPTQATDARLSFELSVRVHGSRPDGSPNVVGPFAQGPAAGRFLGVTSGTLAGQADSCWTRVAKVPRSGITWSLIEAAIATPGAVIAVHIAGSAKDGGPACATVPLLDGGWCVEPQRHSDGALEPGG